MKTKSKEDSAPEVCEKSCEVKKAELKAFLIRKMPAMFDRTPDITGDLNKFVEEVLAVISCK